MSYSYPYYGQQPYPYQDQLGQLRNAPVAMPGQSFPAFQGRPDSSGILWVQGEAGAKSWFVNPGSSVLLMDSEGMRFYLKSADASGIPTMKTFEYKEVTAGAPTAAAEHAQFVTAEEFNGFKADVLGRLEELAEPVEVSLSRKKKGEANE